MSKFCTNCGAELPDDSVFCTSCGERFGLNASAAGTNSSSGAEQFHDAQAENAADSQAFAQRSQAQNSSAFESSSYSRYFGLPPQGRYGVVSTGAFFGLMFVFAIPIIGFIVSLVLSIVSEKDNMKNFARASLIWSVISLVLWIVLFCILFAFADAVPYSYWGGFARGF